jgi:hypothetical protein
MPYKMPLPCSPPSHTNFSDCKHIRRNALTLLFWDFWGVFVNSTSFWCGGFPAACTLTAAWSDNSNRKKQQVRI